MRVCQRVRLRLCLVSWLCPISLLSALPGILYECQDSRLSYHRSRQYRDCVGESHGSAWNLRLLLATLLVVYLKSMKERGVDLLLVLGLKPATCSSDATLLQDTQ
jgi:hypothetical protein